MFIDWTGQLPTDRKIAREIYLHCLILDIEEVGGVLLIKGMLFCKKCELFSNAMYTCTFILIGTKFGTELWGGLHCNERYH
jgi:hypothetical protein